MIKIGLISMISLFIQLSALSIYAQTGCVSGNCDNGWGVYNFSSGEFYEGDSKDGQPHGWGTYQWSSGFSYSGFWKEGKRHYFGTYFWPSGSSYSGLFKNNEKLKHGVNIYDSGNAKYYVERPYYSERGCVLGNCQNGYGVYIWPSGNIYAGFWKNGKVHYWGAKFWKEDFYIGLWKDGDMERQGLYVYESAKPDFRISRPNYAKTGCVAGNCDNGFGVYIWPSGNIHAGSWKNGEMHYWGSFFWQKDFFYGLYKEHFRENRGINVINNGNPNYMTGTVTYQQQKKNHSNSNDVGTVVRGLWGTWYTETESNLTMLELKSDQTYKSVAYTFDYEELVTIQDGEYYIKGGEITLRPNQKYCDGFRAPPSTVDFELKDNDNILSLIYKVDGTSYPSDLEKLDPDKIAKFRKIIAGKKTIECL